MRWRPIAKVKRRSEDELLKCIKQKNCLKFGIKLLSKIMIFIFYYWVNYEFLWKIQEKKALISSKKAPSWKGFIQHISITVIFIKTSSIKCTKQHVRITVASKYQVDVTEKKTHIPTYKHSSKPYIIYLFMFNFGNIKIKIKREKKEEGRKKQVVGGEKIFVYTYCRKIRRNGRKHFHFDDASLLFSPVKQILIAMRKSENVPLR